METVLQTEAEGANVLRKFRFKISLRIFHPTRAAIDIAVFVPLTPRILNTVGDIRTSRDGQVLGGIYSRTYLNYELTVPPDVIFEDFLRAQLSDATLIATDDATGLRASGGKVELFIGIFLDDDGDFELDSDLIGMIAAKKISLSVRLYTKEEK